jgi:hypothetical protein
MLKQALTGKILGSFQGEAATLTVSVLPNDTCAAWLKRPNEEANPQESLCEEDSASTLRETRDC